ncbi:MAG: Fur family transcriptional regulator [Candidatus Theseobacter exili]|nr:Fur family transcriptional regulator [Candidatus Theseobacter exili]
MQSGCRRGRGLGWWHGHIRGYGYRMTAQREAVLEIMTKTREHLSAEDIYHQLHNLYPNIGLTTIYRTLELLVDTGLVYKFDFGDGRARYEISEGPDSPDHHHHLVCTCCGKITNYTDFIDKERKLLNETEMGLSKKFNFKITNHLIQFYGLCEKCNKDEK